MRICIPTLHGTGAADEVCEHFGSAPYFTILDTEGGEPEVIPNTDAALYLALHHLRVDGLANVVDRCDPEHADAPCLHVNLHLRYVKRWRIHVVVAPRLVLQGHGHVPDAHHPELGAVCRLHRVFEGNALVRL